MVNLLKRLSRFDGSTHAHRPERKSRDFAHHRLENLAAFSFLVFFVLTPLTYKIQLRAGIYQEGIYVGPLVPFLVLSLGFFLWSFFRRRRLPVRQAGISLWLRRKEVRELWPSVKNFLIPHPIAKLFYLLLFVLLLSWIYGIFLTGNIAWGDLLRLIKYGLYFLAFPLAIKTAQVLGERGVKWVLFLVFLVGVGASAVSLARIYHFVAEGNVIDFWVYSPESRSVGFLGQYLDLSNFSIGQIPKAAHATFGLYLSVILGVGLVFLSQVRLVSFRFTGFLFGIGIIFVALLYTLSRGAVATGGLVILAGLVWLAKNKRFWVALVLLVFLFLESSILTQLNPEVYQKFASTFPGAQKAVSILVRVSAPVGQGAIRVFEGLKVLVFESEVAAPPPQKAVTVPDVAGYTDLSLDKSLSDRVVMWQNTLWLLRSRLLFTVLGVGYSTDNLRHFTGGMVVYPHSLFLDLWARGGLLALAIVLAIWVFLFAKTAQFWFSKNKNVAAFGMVLFAFLIGWFLDNLISGEQFFSDAPMLAFWGTLGLVQALANSKQRTANSKKVLIALTSSDLGGASQVVCDLLKQVRSQRSEIRSWSKSNFEFIVAAPGGGVFNKKFQGLGYRVYPVPLDRIGIRGFTRLFKIAHKEEIDLINSHGKGAGLYARLVGPLLGIPVVQTIHGLHYNYPNRIVRFMYLSLEKFLTPLTKLMVNVSPSQEKEGIKLGLFPQSKSRVVGNGIDVDFFDQIKVDKNSLREKLGLAPRDFVLTMVARFDPVGVRHKGHTRFIKFLPDLVAAVPNLKVVFVGDGKTRRAVESLARQLGTSRSTVFLGFRGDIPQILKASDALVLPSYHEGMPLTVLEAMACSLPVVGSDVVGIQDVVVDGKTGYLIDFDRKPERLAQVLSRLAKDPSLRRRMGEQGRKWVAERFSMEKFVENTLSVYQESLKN